MKSITKLYKKERHPRIGSEFSGDGGVHSYWIVDVGIAKLRVFREVGNNAPGCATEQIVHKCSKVHHIIGL